MVCELFNFQKVFFSSFHFAIDERSSRQHLNRCSRRSQSKFSRAAALAILLLAALTLAPEICYCSQPSANSKIKKIETVSRDSIASRELQSAFRHYLEKKTLTANFTQLRTQTALGTTKKTSGKLSVSNPGRFRWETLEPEKSILTTNGKKIWFYTPPFRPDEKGQVVIRSANDQTKLAVELLSGSADLRASFQTRKTSENQFELRPLRPAGDVDRIRIELERPTKLVYKITLFSSTGNQTEITLSQVELGSAIHDDFFEFKAPANTEEVRE